jgi:predicted nucleic acid-binding Zn ribbon protein
MTLDTTEPHPDDWADLQQRAEAHRRWFHGRQPKPVANIIAQLVQRKGYAQVRQAGQYNDAWASAAGHFAAQSEVGQLSRGVLEVTVANSLVMQELTFEKERILAALKAALPDAGVKQLRLRVGKIG